jgi:hypothetical protein
MGPDPEGVIGPRARPTSTTEELHLTLAFAFVMSAAVQQVDTLTLEPALARAPLSTRGAFAAAIAAVDAARGTPRGDRKRPRSRHHGLLRKAAGAAFGPGRRSQTASAACGSPRSSDSRHPSQ